MKTYSLLFSLSCSSADGYGALCPGAPRPHATAIGALDSLPGPLESNLRARALVAFCSIGNRARNLKAAFLSPAGLPQAAPHRTLSLGPPE